MALIRWKVQHQLDTKGLNSSLRFPSSVSLITNKSSVTKSSYEVCIILESIAFTKVGQYTLNDNSRLSHNELVNMASRYR